MNAIYLVLDMQNDLVNAKGVNGTAPLGEQVRSRDLLARTARAIASARAAGIRVGFVRVGFSPDYRECPPNSPVFTPARANGIFKLGTWGTQIHPDLVEQPQDLQIIKHRVSPFHATALDQYLRTLEIGRIYCSGVSTQAVVQATVREGHDRDYDMVVLEDCCAAHSAEEHRNSIQSLGRFCRVVGSEQAFAAQ